MTVLAVFAKSVSQYRRKCCLCCQRPLVILSMLMCILISWVRGWGGRERWTVSDVLSTVTRPAALSKLYYLMFARATSSRSFVGIHWLGKRDTIFSVCMFVCLTMCVVLCAIWLSYLSLPSVLYSKQVRQFLQPQEESASWASTTTEDLLASTHYVFFVSSKSWFIVVLLRCLVLPFFLRFKLQLR